MSFGDEAIRSLRDALALSPDNLPLRLHLARTLSSAGRHDEAEQECRAALAAAPENIEVKLALAGCFFQQQKNSEALVIVEALVRGADAPAAAHLLYARLLERAGDVRDAVAQYKLAVEQDESLADAEFADRLGIVPEEQAGQVYEGRVRESWRSEPDDGRVEMERPKMGFDDVGGMYGLKDEIAMKIIHPLQNPDLYAAYGKAIGGGILLYGPPGCGKTYLARATAGQIAANFISIGISDVLDMWIGSSERNLRELFDQARANKPCVLFFDEVDALGARRSELQGGTQRQLINQFLAELDGVEANNEGLLVLGATNAPWHLDPAFRRPGRFDRVLFVPPPDATAREEILKLLLRGKPTRDVDLVHLAKKTDRFSGADLKAVVDVTIEQKLREAMKQGVPQPITTKDLAAAVKQVRPSTSEWFSTARNYAVYSNQGGLYDDVLKYMKL